MATRWTYIPPNDYIFTPSASFAMSALGVFASATPLLVAPAAANFATLIAIPLYNTLDAAGRFYPSQATGPIKAIHVFTSISGINTGAAAAMASAWGGVNEYNLSAGLNISAAAASATLGVQAQLPNTLTSAGFVPSTEASGTAWTFNNTAASTGGLFTYNGLLPSGCPLVINEIVVTAPNVYTGPGGEPNQLSATRVVPYVPRLYPTYQALIISTGVIVSAAWFHYGTMVEYF